MTAQTSYDKHTHTHHMIQRTQTCCFFMFYGISDSTGSKSEPQCRHLINIQLIENLDKNIITQSCFKHVGGVVYNRELLLFHLYHNTIF